MIYTEVNTKMQIQDEIERKGKAEALESLAETWNHKDYGNPTPFMMQLGDEYDKIISDMGKSAPSHVKKAVTYANEMAGRN